MPFYLEALAGETAAKLAAAAKTHVRASRWFPKPAELLALCNPAPPEPQIPLFPTNSESLDEIADRRRALAHRWAEVKQALQQAGT